MVSVEKIESKKIDDGIGKENVKKNVCAYCRVSTELDSQKDSFETQVTYYENYIKSNPNWNFIGVYSDYGLSGTGSSSRIGLNDLLDDVRQNKIDLIITKSVSRLTRNLFDLCKYLDIFRKNNVIVHFEEENIDTSDPGFELGLKLRTTLAEEEVRNTSNHIKRSIQMKAQNGIPSGQIQCIGYDYNPKDKSLTINEEEAKIVRYIFDSYLKGIGCDLIAENLTSQGIKPKRNISGSWCSSSVRRIIRNEKYIGDIAIGKTYTPDPINDKKRRINRGSQDIYIIHNHHEPIVSKDIFDKAQEILSKRSIPRSNGNSANVLAFRNQYAFSSKLKCAYCGSSLIRHACHSSTKYEKSVWGCMKRVKHNKACCPNSKNIDEKVIESAFIEAYNRVFSDNNDVINEFLDIFKKQFSEENATKKVEDLNKKIISINDKKDKLLELRFNDVLDDELFKSKLEVLNDKLEKYKNDINDLSAAAIKEKELSKSFEGLMNHIDTGKPLQEFDRSVWDCVVKECIVGGSEDGNDEPYKLTFVFKLGNPYSCNSLDYKSARRNFKTDLCSSKRHDGANKDGSVSLKDTHDILKLSYQ